jgi:hypothetical protein
VKIVVHEATVKPISDLKGVVGNIIERHWQVRTYQSIPAVPTGSLISMGITVPKAVESDLSSGTQEVWIAAFMTYNDGFPNSPEQTWTFCDASRHNADTKDFTMVPCDNPDQLLRLLADLDRYPNPQYQVQ